MHYSISQLCESADAFLLISSGDDENSFIDSGVEDSPFIHCR